ncbi:SRA stem-loop-interacting RNA-binding protein, mitochondrial [Narcine bancroftii]|uniref:SRA stem-loop-interacting RNA-binding protein, mitochondrial n=1 Tax=Narcine bancroftii TaxID=1343680 RepID=UPI00383221E2
MEPRWGTCHGPNSGRGSDTYFAVLVGSGKVENCGEVGRGAAPPAEGGRAAAWVGGRRSEVNLRGPAMAATLASSRKLFEVFVARVPWTLSSKEIKEYFGQFGSVKKCLLPFDKEIGFHKGFCWVGFTTEEGLQNVLQKEVHIIEDSKLQVQRNRKLFQGQRANRITESAS